MSLRRVNILTLEPDDELDEAGFRHRQAELRPSLGSDRIQATLYAADPGRMIWPFHYHYGVEEWLYVTSGTPTLRDHHGQRQLEPGDLISFPPGPAGSHTLAGPGRFLILSTGIEREPWMSVYPDSGKISGPEGILLTASRVEYWHGEGTWESGPEAEPDTPRARELAPSQPIVNVDSLEPGIPADYDPPTGYGSREVMLGGLLGAQMLGATLYELDPGVATAPYHHERGREEWVLVLSGAPVLRHPGGEDVLAAGDVVCFPDGPAGAHQLINRADGLARLIILSTKEPHSTVHYPDSGKLLIRAGNAQRLVFRERDAVDYWLDEPTPR